jgi:glutamate carboxypeptidase
MEGTYTGLGHVMSGTFASVPQSLSWLDQQRGALEGLVGELVRLDSHTGDAAGVERVVELLESELAALDLSTERIAAPPFGPHLAFRGPAHGAPVFLVGHTDTVFPPGTFTGWRVEGESGHGPGAFDMKGGLAVLLFGLAAAHRAGLLARLPVAGLLVSDEEVGSPSSQPHLRRLAAGARAALVFESGRPGDLVVVQRKGTGSVQVVARGVAAHAGNEHEKGRSAIWSLARFVEAAQRLTDYPRGVTVSVGTFHGGTSKNTVPEAAECEVDLRFLTDADGQRLVEALRAACVEAALEGTRLELSPASWRSPLARTPASAALAEAYGACQRQSGLSSGEAPLAGGGSDACTTGAMSIPTIDGLGPRGSGFHTRDERVALDSLVPKAQALLRYLARLAG